MKFFNTAGPVNPEDHYCLSPLHRFDLDEILSLIDQKKYFILHAPRQTGKTTCMKALMEYLNTSGAYTCLYINIESAQAARENVAGGIHAIIDEIYDRCKDDKIIPDPKDLLNGLWEQYSEFSALSVVLSRLSSSAGKPIVLLVDEIDALVGDTLISTLRQIRKSYDKRPILFPQSIVLCGVRDIRDYRIHSDREKSIITGGSAFNIKAESLRLGNFTESETTGLCLQHTTETGQIFESAALKLIWYYSAGQPWLVNALAYEVCFKMEEGRVRTVPITREMVIIAKDRLIARQETHLDQLTDKLREERVRRVIEPMLIGEIFEQEFRRDDLEYVLDLGLISQESNGSVHIANPIYQEVIPRELTWSTQAGITVQSSWFIDRNGLLDMNQLLAAFQQFYRENSGSWLEIAQYREAGPHLLLQAFLQRIVNGGGKIEREYGLGRGRTDLLIIWPYGTGQLQRVIIEIKIMHRSREITIRDGIAQTCRYRDHCDADESHLVIIDRTPDTPWEEKIFARDEIYTGTPDRPIHCPVTIWGM
ncbi:MAG: AAA family ATPase [Methanobacteriota archaeon]